MFIGNAIRHLSNTEVSKLLATWVMLRFSALLGEPMEKPDCTSRLMRFIEME
jgi:hypothetical protein